MPPVNVEPQRRLPELDSLRGLAAFVVVMYHFVLMWPEWLWSMHGIQWHGLHLTVFFHPLYTGHEAVRLFFVLSGMVLAFPYIRGRSQPYPIFLVRRILRIYGPYVVAITFSIIGAAIWHGPHGHGKWAASFWSEPIRLSLVLQHIAFIGVYDWNQFNFVIWSLIYEMRISILYPFLVILILRLKTRSALLLAGVLSFITALIVWHQPESSATFNLMMTVHYVGLFIVGILLAMHLKAISAWFRSLPSVVRYGMLILSFFLYNYGSLLWHLDDRLPLFIAGDWLVAAGAVGFIIVGLNLPLAQRFLNSLVPHFLGKISYSLYLIHAPILLALTFGLHNRISYWAQLPIYLTTAITCAYLFFIFVEQPFVRAGQRLGKKKLPLVADPAPSQQAEAIPQG